MSQGYNFFDFDTSFAPETQTTSSWSNVTFILQCFSITTIMFESIQALHYFLSLTGRKLNKGAGHKCKVVLKVAPVVGIIYYFYEMVYVLGFEASVCFCNYTEFLKVYDHVDIE